ncbi:hypothetical protein [Pedobacter hiemivivus]|uniref:Uncharacterized protein n=1 Tax=Pedobacter hiemivivus TaxID=2530454 RepID=A0A4R0NKP0_9SPHI|nr:hypothetical protein [Pedobacter hiemivivus]TCC99544.1 hypothetical protein EZ444_02385 [Pedobacter hiemivivus]
MKKEPIEMIKDRSSLDKNFYLKLEVEFGPAFSKNNITNEKFLELLNEEKKTLNNGFLSGLINHIVDKLQQKVEVERGADNLQNQSERKYSGIYYSCDSCGKGKRKYCYYDPVLGVTFCQCEGC